jgi:hypothetical protein
LTVGVFKARNHAAAAVRATRSTVPQILTALLLACGGRERNPTLASAGDASVSTIDRTMDSGAPSRGLPAGYAVAPSGLAAPGDECQTAGDCPVFGAGRARCVELVSGYRTCVNDVQVATVPSDYPSVDQCDATRPCALGACYATTVYASGQCGLGGASVQNRCQSDACSTDADCSGGVCGPPGLTSDALIEGGGVRQCLEADCRSNADCTEQAGGVCALVAGSCGPGESSSNEFRPAQLACVYAGGCVRASDCPKGACTIVAGSARCLYRSP